MSVDIRLLCHCRSQDDMSVVVISRTLPTLKLRAHRLWTTVKAARRTHLVGFTDREEYEVHGEVGVTSGRMKGQCLIVE